jgi:uncharacterized protein (TIGR03086 family)
MTSNQRSSDRAERYARALDATRKFVAGIGDDRWDDPTPCSEWNVRALLNHMIYGTIWIEDIFDGRTVDEVGDKYDGDLAGADTLAAYDAVVASAKKAIAAPDAMERVCHLRRRDTSGADYVTSMFTDIFIHGWDLAKATGQDATLDLPLVEEAYALARPREERLRESLAFGSGRVKDPGDSASLQTRLLAILGREAGWTP